MQKLTALVTGATGFIGSHLCVELVKKGFKVYGLSRSGSAKNKEFLSLVEKGDIYKHSLFVQMFLLLIQKVCQKLIIFIMLQAKLPFGEI